MSNHQSLFHRPKDASYFLTHSIGLLPRSTDDCLRSAYLDQWRSGGEDIWNGWLDGIGEFRQALATLLNSSADQFCPQTNVSSGLSKVLMALPREPGKNVIVATERDFPSASFVLKQAERLGFSLKLIPEAEDLQALDTWDRVIDAKVAVAFITQVNYNTNRLAPVEQIADLCREKSVFSIVDTAQATGIVDIDLSNTCCDILLGSCIKWLCGGPGAGFLWLKKDLIEQLRPYDVGWFSHRDPFEFDIHNFEYADNASRFWGGTPSVAPFVAASNSIKVISKIGVSNIAQHNRLLTQKLIDCVPRECFASPLDLNKKGGTSVLAFKRQRELEKVMRANKLLFDSREFGIRISPHIYTSESDISKLIDCLQEHLKKVK